MKKLYYESAYIKEFESTVLSCVQGKKGYEIELEETAFYPEGGGQPSDTGKLGEANVLEVHERNGRILHDTDRPLTVGEKVKGQIDWPGRFLHMQEHSGEHLVSGLIHQRFGYDNVGFHMGSEEVTIDLNGLLEWEDLLEIEKKANEIIWEDRELHVWFPSESELKTLDYRSKKELSGDIRIVEIPGGDICACCGTHVKRTGEIGLVKFLSMIHYKGGVRISLLCGSRAVEDYEKRREELHRISVLLSAKPEKAADAVEKLKQEMAELQTSLAACFRQLIEWKVDRMEEKEGNVYVMEPEFGPLQLRQLVNCMLEKKKGKVILALSKDVDGKIPYVLGSQSEDMRLLSKELNNLLSGRGGGSAQMAQGTFFAEEGVLSAVLQGKGFLPG